MEIKVELNIPADLEIELSSTFLVEPSRQFGVEHSYTEFLELSNCSLVRSAGWYFFNLKTIGWTLAQRHLQPERRVQS